ncbi:hypothetical protein BHQ18_09185 [Mycolicibacterium flavescens]|uniref:Uncharacterized protein n=1 Tax=Mycolicibacterium flavescens TaxID=1776 RepID=A0A1E3RLV7_MYCFV|nr:hypothetical protein BHQ18_09185 [Mycolicibacterium flavescens]
MPVKPLLPGQSSEPCRLGEITVVALDEVEFQIEVAQADKPYDVVEAHCRTARLPPRNRRLRGASAVRELCLCQTCAFAGLADQIAAIGHWPTITELLYAYWHQRT